MKPDVEQRVRNEALYYDSGRLNRDSFRAPLAYLDGGIGRSRRDEAVRTAMQDAAGARVLEIGSQSWQSSLFRYGYRPETLVCINISEAELETGRAIAAQCGWSAEFRKMDAHNLAFEDGSFDIVFGTAILHHLEFSRALREIHRVLRVGGKIVFVEPLRHNPVARLVRWLTPHARTPDELPLGRPELHLINRNFASMNHYTEMFAVLGAMVARPIFSNPVNPITRFCDRVDDSILRMIPAANVYYRSVVIHGVRRSATWNS
ncbi:MAG TPA: class I SAM-dependent methyltransferase [Stellaceae bacterium]|jgi:SAM-dependent methyltransferase